MAIEDVLSAPLSWLELSRANLLHNLAGVRKLVGTRRIMAVLKANAYGAGAAGMASMLASAGVDAFGVATVAEGVELREAGIAGTIACLAYFSREEVPAISDYDLIPTIFTLDAAHLLSEAAIQDRKSRTQNRVWVKVDTGLGRLGVPFQAAPEFIRQVRGQTGLEIEGLLSTLAENPGRDALQVQRLLDVRRAVPELMGLQLSLASSNGILSLPASCLDVVRPGIMLLGLEPSERERLDLDLLRRADLQPVATWKARVGYVKVAPAGEQVGYGRRAALVQELPVATLTVGWASGYPPGMSGGHTLVRGQRCPIIEVSANSTIVDVASLPQVAIGDEAVLLGRQGNEEITAAEMARASGESVYRLLARIPREVSRTWD